MVLGSTRCPVSEFSYQWVSKLRPSGALCRVLERLAQSEALPPYSAASLLASLNGVFVPEPAIGTQKPGSENNFR